MFGFNRHIDMITCLSLVAAVSLLFAGSGCKKQQDIPVNDSTAPDAAEVSQVEEVSQNDQKNDNSSETVTPSTGEPEQQEQKAESNQDDKDFWMPDSIDLNIFKNLKSEEAEQKILMSFSNANPPDDEDILSLRKLADEGNDEAAEKLALHYIHLPATDVRHALGMDYIRKIKSIQSAEALYYRGLAEFDNSGENVEKAKPLVGDELRDKLPLLCFQYAKV